jgi:hypothetical protein
MSNEANTFARRFALPGEEHTPAGVSSITN